MRAIVASILLATAAAPGLAQEAPDVEEATIGDVRAMMAAGMSSEAITRAYLARIAAMDRQGPSLRAVIAVNPDALSQARASDARRAAGRLLGPLDGVPILIKDNIETDDPMPTTAGSLALKDNVTHRDAPVVARLRAGGMVILGKTNLSEWANIRSTRAMSGWSAVGGLVKNPYALDRTACGSSSGSGAAVAASFAPAALGTETDGSVVCPASINGLVGLKPTIGLVSRTHIVPISRSQDTAGPMATTVRGAAMLFSAMIGSDPDDPATADADQYRRDYAAGLSDAALQGTRIGVIRPVGMPDAVMTRYNAALDVLKAEGAVLIEVKHPALDGLGDDEFVVLKTELKAGLNAYLATTPAAVKTRTLAALIAFDETHAAEEMPFFGQEIFIEAEKTEGLSDPHYLAAHAAALRLARTQGIDAMLEASDADMLVEPTYAAAWLSDPVYGDQYSAPSSSTLPAVAGYPNLTVPMGLVGGLPVGLSFIGRAYSEAALLGAGYDYEQASHARVPPRYLPHADVGPGLEGAAR